MNRRILRKPEFYTIYAASILDRVVDEEDRKILAWILYPIAEKYRNITLHALRAELRHYNRYGERNCHEQCRRNTLKLIGIDAPILTSRIRRTISPDAIIRVFSSADWFWQYGGKPWADIGRAYKVLEHLLPPKSRGVDVRRTVLALDRLNDLEHNTALYLASYCTFDLTRALWHKAWTMTTQRYIIDRSTREIKKLAWKYRWTLKDE